MLNSALLPTRIWLLFLYKVCPKVCTVTSGTSPKFTDDSDLSRCNLELHGLNESRLLTCRFCEVRRRT